MAGFGVLDGVREHTISSSVLKLWPHSQLVQLYVVWRVSSDIVSDVRTVAGQLQCGQLMRRDSRRTLRFGWFAVNDIARGDPAVVVAHLLRAVVVLCWLNMSGLQLSDHGEAAPQLLHRCFRATG